MKVIKFGGSSLANSQQIKKVFQIVQADSDRRIVVVSAPGKRHSDDEKVTDLLIQLATSHIEGKYNEAVLEVILERYQEIYDELQLNSDVMDKIRQHFAVLQESQLEPAYLMDAYKASGEDNNAKLIADYFTK